MMNGKVILAFVLALSCPIIGSAENQKTQSMDEASRARMGLTKDEARFQKIVDQSSEAYAAIVKGTQGAVPASVLSSARCIAVLPGVLSGALVVGGTHGNGLASCRDTNNAWSQPAAVSLNQGSIGLQVGAKSADIVLFIQSNEAVAALKSGNFKIGADMSAVAGAYDTGVDMSQAGVVAYTRAEGLFAGAAVTGGTISKNETDLERFYGKRVDFAALLDSRETPDSSGYSQKLTKQFPS